MEHVRFSLFISTPVCVFVPHPKFYYWKGIWVFSSFMWGLSTWVARAKCPWVVTISTAADNIILLTLLRSYCDKVCPPIKLQTIFSHNAVPQLILCCCINWRKQTNVQCLSLYLSTTKNNGYIHFKYYIYVHFIIELLVNFSHVLSSCQEKRGSTSTSTYMISDIIMYTCIINVEYICVTILAKSHQP